MKIYDYNGKKNICGDRLREAGIRVESLAIVETMDDNAVYFRK